jgi:hypothetical protein
MNQDIRELVAMNTLTDAYLILAECKKLKALLALELQATRDDRKEQHKQFREFMFELLETLDQIRARHLIDAQILNLIEPRKDLKNRENGKIKVNLTKRS